VKIAKGKDDHINFVPPTSVAKAAERGLDYRKKGGGGGLSTEEASKQGIGSGVQRAVNLKNRDKLSPATVRRMNNFFNRHQKNKAIDAKFKGTPWKDRGYVAWLLWGGDPGRSWASKIVRQMDAADKKKTAKATGVKQWGGESVGLFIPLPKNLAKKFPSLGEEDTSPSHVTFLYIGDVKGEKEQKHLLQVLEDVHAKWWPEVTAKLDGLDHFDHPDKDRRVAFVKVDFDKDLSGMRHRVKQALLDADIQVDDKFPEYKPHVTLAYMPGIDTPDYEGEIPEGEWSFKDLEVWGLPEVHKIKFRPSSKRVAASWMRSKVAGWWAISPGNPGINPPPVDKGGLMNALPGTDPGGARYNGDGPADTMGNTFANINDQYMEAWGRPATQEEMQAVFDFVFGGFKGHPENYMPKGKEITMRVAKRYLEGRA
jgi:2'-5' RNA ligase